MVNIYIVLKLFLITSKNTHTSYVFCLVSDSKGGRPVLKAYGSFAMDMFFARSDLDVSFNFGDGASELPRDTKLQFLGRFAEKLRSLQGKFFFFFFLSIFVIGKYDGCEKLNFFW